MRRNFECIVVGGGLAGLTSAAYLTRAGIPTLLLERRRKLGGLVETFWHQGFAFDGGIRAFENSGIVFPMLRQLGIELEFVKNDVTIGIEKARLKLQGKESLPAYGEMLTKLFPENREDIGRILIEIQKVMGYMDVLYGIDNPLFLDKMEPNYLVKTLLPWFLRYQGNIRKAGKLQAPIREHLAKFTRNEALIDMIAQHFFQNTPAFFALSYFSLYLDYCYPRGGTGSLAEKMVEYIRGNQGTLRTGIGVSRVDGKNRTITLDNGEELMYRKLIWAADQRSLYECVEGVTGEKFLRQKALVEKSQGGDSLFTVFLGADLDKAYVEEHCGAHMFFTPTLQGLSSVMPLKHLATATLEEIYGYTREYLKKTTYEISCPSLREEKLAPAGKTGLMVSTLFEYCLIQRVRELGAYEEFKRFSEEIVLGVLEDALLPGLAEALLFRFSATPLTMEKETANYQGAITGWAFTNDPMPSEDQFKKIMNAVETPIPEVYQCGQWTFSPSGLPVSILTGKVAADKVMKDRPRAGASSSSGIIRV